MADARRYVEARPVETPSSFPTGESPQSSQEVSWWRVHQFITALVAKANTSLPWAGTPAWSALNNDDPRKLLALAVAGEHHVLRIETAQEAIVSAGEEVSAAAPWSEIAQHQLERARWEETHPWARRHGKGDAA